MTEESKANFFEPDGITYINNILSSSKERKEKENKENFERYNDFKIDKKLFTEIIHAICTHDNFQTKFSNFLNSEILEEKSFVKVGDNLVCALIKVLQLYFDPADKLDGMIDWWLYENVEKVLYETNGNKIDVSTPENLYEYLNYFRAKEHSSKQ